MLSALNRRLSRSTSKSPEGKGDPQPEQPQSTEATDTPSAAPPSTPAEPTDDAAEVSLPALRDDLYRGRDVLVDGREAMIERVDFPLIYYTYSDVPFYNGAEKHRSFLHDRHRFLLKPLRYARRRREERITVRDLEATSPKYVPPPPTAAGHNAGGDNGSLFAKGPTPTPPPVNRGAKPGNSVEDEDGSSDEDSDGSSDGSSEESTEGSTEGGSGDNDNVDPGGGGCGGGVGGAGGAGGAGGEDVKGEWYLVSTVWLSQWFGFTSGALEEPPGPIDNTPLVKEDGVTPREGIVRIKHFRGVHRRVWLVLFMLYGGGPEINR
jgi:hypothetical protein